MSSVSVSVEQLKVPIEAVRRLLPEQRYVYYLLALIHNEAMALRKLISFSLPVSTDMRPFKRGPEMAQTLFLFRIACCKIWEAKEKLNCREVHSVLVRDVYPAWSEGIAKRKHLNKLLNETKWLHALRNQLGFHYPEFEQWLPFTTPTDTWVDDIVYVADEPGNQFFEGPEGIVRHQMFSAVPGASPPEQAVRWAEQAGDLLVAISEFTEQAVGHFTAAHMVAADARLTPVGKVRAPSFDEVVIPFWTGRDRGRKRRGSLRSSRRGT